MTPIRTASLISDLYRRIKYKRICLRAILNDLMEAKRILTLRVSCLCELKKRIDVNLPENGNIFRSCSGSVQEANEKYVKVKENYCRISREQRSLKKDVRHAQSVLTLKRKELVSSAEESILDQTA